MGDLVDLGCRHDSLHRVLEDHVQIGELFHLGGQLLVDVRPIEDPV